MNNQIDVVSYTPDIAHHFEQLNKQWIVQFFQLEEVDKYVLENPGPAIINNGGEILFAKYAGHIIGTVALRKISPMVFELTKMAVDHNYRGLGAGRLLCLKALETARTLKAERIILYSNRALETAIKLYRKQGFQEIPLEEGVYERADIKMEYIL